MSSNVQLDEYLSQLSAVEEALKYASEGQKSELMDLKSKLQEVISLLGSTAADIEESSNDSNEDEANGPSSMDDEFAKFQKEIMEMDGGARHIEHKQVDGSENSSSEDSIEIPNQELSAVLSSLEGSKCRAPYSFEWGEKDYHNAMILSADFHLCLLNKDFEVSVMFCNPVCEKMKPCSFFLNGHCRFSDEMCRFSHGYKVKFSELQEFVLPDFGQLIVDAKCLAKGKDNLWESATIEKCLPEQAYVVKSRKTGKTMKLDIHDIMPLDNSSKADSSDSETDFNNETYSNNASVPNFLHNGTNAHLPPSASFSPTVWEQHTKGIGSKLMEKMGHVWGQGLGKNSDGRLDPIEAIILPAGKSLDKCIEMRDKCNPKGPVPLEAKLELEQDREKQRAKRVPVDVQRKKRKNVFDFINSRISKVKSDEDQESFRKSHQEIRDNPKASDKNLNVQIFSVGEDIKKAKKELCRLQQSLVRNSDRNEAVRSQVEKKIAAQNSLLKSLEVKEQRLSDSITSQTNKKKLTIF